MPWPAHPHRRSARCHVVRNLRPARQHERQRARPEGLGKPSRQGRPAFHAARGHVEAGDVDDDGIGCRPAFNFEDFGDGGFIERVGGEAVDRFCGKRNDLAGAEQFHRAFHGGGEQCRRVRGQHFRLHRAEGESTGHSRGEGISVVRCFSSFIRSAAPRWGRAGTLSMRDKNRRKYPPTRWKGRRRQSTRPA